MDVANAGPKRGFVEFGPKLVPICPAALSANTAIQDHEQRRSKTRCSEFQFHSALRATSYCL